MVFELFLIICIDKRYKLYYNMNIFSYSHIRSVMDKNKFLLSNEQVFELVTDFKALGDVGRLKIVLCLISGKKSVGEISNLVGLSQSATSHQLRILKEARILRSNKIGTVNMYEIADDHVKTIIEKSVEHLDC